MVEAEAKRNCVAKHIWNVLCECDGIWIQLELGHSDEDGGIFEFILTAYLRHGLRMSNNIKGQKPSLNVFISYISDSNYTKSAGESVPQLIKWLLTSTEIK